MATLTGFKRVRDQSAKGAKAKDQDGTGAQPNPTFVFDEVDVNNGKNPDELTDDEEQQQKQAKVIEAEDSRANKQQNNRSEDNHKQSDNNQQDSADNTKTNNHNNSSSNRSSISDRHFEQAPETHQQQNDSINNNNSQQPPASTTPPQPNQRSTQGSNNRLQQLNGASSKLNPSSPNADSVSVTMLAVDCVGSGKSPRTPRRSPLMALFKGKPRESVRRLYTEEDQFTIEWADLSMELQLKWYQKIQFGSSGAGDAGGRDDWGSGAQQQQDQQQAPQFDPMKAPAKTGKKILKNVDGRLKSGEITAVLGPSGAGKTSLLNGLFGKYRSSVQGSIKVQGAPTKKHLTVCTIPQSDYLIGYLTTQESLWFASRLKNCEDDFNHNRNIERVIELLGLQSCRDTRINKLSGGQYKRVSIAQEMLSSPDILVLDEPTSGLDSLTCYRTVKVLRDLVEASKAHNLVNPMSIILTIHQPHREVLDLFHSVYVMAVGGLTMYQGPPSEMEDVINRHSGIKMPAEGYNPASFMVELASEEYGKKPIEMLVRYQREKFKSTTKNKYQFQEPHPIDEISGSYNQMNMNKQAIGSWYKGVSVDNKKTDSSVALHSLDNNKSSSFVDINLDDQNQEKRNSATSYNSHSPMKDIDSRIMTPRSGKNSDGVFWRHVNLMSKRCFLANTRDPLLFTMRFLAHIFIPLVVALIYGPNMGIPNGCPFYKTEINLFEYANVGVEEIRGKHDAIRIQFQNVGLHFMVYYAFGLCMLAFTAISFPLIMHVLVKEIRNGWYSLASFIVGKMVSELPMALALPPISVAIIYYLTGQPASYFQWRYMIQSVILILLIMIAEAKGLIFGAVCMNSMQTAVFAASVSTVPFILLSGFLIRIHEIPSFLQGAAHLSYFKHSVEALIITRYGFGMCPCDPADIPPDGTPRIVGVSPQIMALTDYYLVPPPEDDSAETTTSSSGVIMVETTTELNVPGNNKTLERVVRAIGSLPASIPLQDPRGNNNRNQQHNERVRRFARFKLKSGSRSTTTTTTPEPTTTEELEETTTSEPPKKQGKFFNKLATLLTRANAFGFKIETCADVEPFTMKDMKLTDNMLPWLLGYLAFTIIALKLMSYFIVDFCVKLKL